MEFKKCKLGSVANIVMGQSPKVSSYNNKKIGVPFLQGNKTFGRLYPTIDTWTTEPKKVAKKNSILMSVRAPVGDLNIANSDICIGRGLCSIEMNNGNNRYLLYLLKNSVNSIKQRISGTVFDSINKNELENIEIINFDIEKQNKITNILSKIDEKIELNNHINDNLQGLIKQNYSKYLKELEESNKFKEIGIKDFFEFESGIEPGSRNYLEHEEPDTIKFYRVGDMNTECKTFIKKDLAKNKYINENDIVVSFDATVGRIGYGLNGAFSTGV